jgi:8-oxo-dGTP pyrophosphatase MutT (NUDIX family)
MPEPARAQIAVGLIVAEGGRLLLQLRDAKPGLTDAGRWGFFGGHIEDGERPEEAFLREMQEELTWRPRHFEHFLTRDVDTDAWQATSHAYAAHLDVPLEALEQREGQDMALFDAQAVPENAVAGVAAFIDEFARSRAYTRMQRTWPLITATALLVDRKGRFLLQHRDDKPDIANPGMWGSFGGEVEAHETPEHGFLREMDEELGWRPARYEFVNAYPFEEGGSAVLVYVYAALVDVPESSLVLGEGQGLGLFAPDALPEKTVPALRGLIEWWVETALYGAIRA